MGTAKHHILVVEDDDDLRGALLDILGDEGFVMGAAADGLQALEYLRRSPQKPSLILLDLMMPKMNGFQFREAQLENPTYADIPVVVLTANFAERAQSLGVASVVRKPVAIDTLLALVTRVLDTRRAPADVPS